MDSNRWAILLQFDGSEEQWLELSGWLMEELHGRYLDRAPEMSGQRVGRGPHPEECPAAATIMVIGCECGTGNAESPNEKEE